MNIRYFSVMLAVMAAVVGQVGVTNGTTWDVYNDYDTTVDENSPNPNGAWSYGYQVGLDYSQGDPFQLMDFPHSTDGGQNQIWGTFTYYQWAGVPSIFMSPNKTPEQYFVMLRGGAVNFNPGLEDQLGEDSLDAPRTTVRWTAPATGTYSIDALFEGVATFHYHNGLASADVNILKNGVSIFSGEIRGGVGIPGIEGPNGALPSQAFLQNLSLAAGDKLDFSVGDGIKLGDLNLDGYIDAGDYVFWRKNGGTPADYDLFRKDFNYSPLGSGADSVNVEITISDVAGAGTSISASVPEPATLSLVLVAGLALAARRVR